MDGDFSYLIWVNGQPPYTVLEFGALTISVSTHGKLIYNDGANYIERQLALKNGWNSLLVERKNMDVIVGLNGNIVDTLALTDKVTYSGTLTINPNTTLDIFDVRLYDKAISTGGYFYYCGEITTNSGKVFCPLWV